MSEIIPGGRQRSSSEGDLLDDEEELSYNGHRGLSPLHRKVSQSAHLRFADRPEYIETTAHRDGISTLDRKKKYKRPLFKSMKHSVMKMVRRTVHSSAENGTENENSYNVRAIVTPTLRRKGKAGEQSIAGETAHFANMNLVARHNDWENNDNSASSSRPLMTQRIIKLKGGVTPGTVGLKNHGNTCFMNAVLQCLSHTDALTEYFITEQYKEDIGRHNKSNAKKFGTKGEVLEQMAHLVRALWSNRYTPEVSNHFKNVVGKYNSQYEGNFQHDAQEFLLWLLDKMHEDLNMIGRKKYKANKSQSPQRDEDLAEEATAFSKSFVCDLFQALYRSSLTCLNCHRQSNTFDPYLCVSLPLPQKVLRPVYVTVVYANRHPKQVKIALQCNVQDTVHDLRCTIAAETQIPELRLVLAQVYDDGFHSTYGDHQPLSDIPHSEMVYAFEMLPVRHLDEYQPSFIQIIFINVERISSPQRCYRFCSPQVMQVPRDLNFKELQTQILKHMAEDIRDGVLSQAQRLSVLFRLRVVDGSMGKCYLNPDVELPLYMQIVDRAESLYSERGYGPPHIKLVVEWESYHKESLVVNDEDYIEEHPSVAQAKKSEQRPRGASLDECFQLYTQEEKLSGDDAWLCPYCKKQQNGTMKKLGLWSLPDVFVVHLKRFKQVGTRRNKLNTLVQFPVVGLNMASHLVQRTINNNTQYCDNTKHNDDRQMALLGGSDKDVYDLYAVCNHYGDMCGGHYTAFCKNPVDEQWYLFDDSKVSAMPESEVVDKAAYLLFYQRRSRFQNRPQELQLGNHWVFSLDNLVDPTAMTHFVSPPSSPSKSRPSRGGASPGLGRKKSSGSDNPAVTPPMQRHYSMPQQSARQQQQKYQTDRVIAANLGDGQQYDRQKPPPTSPKPVQNSSKPPPTSPKPANNNNNKRSSGNLASKPPLDNRQTQLPPNHSVTFNVDSTFESPEPAAQLYVALPKDHSSNRPLSAGNPSSRSPSSRGSSADRSPKAGLREKLQSPIPYADERHPVYTTPHRAVKSPVQPSAKPPIPVPHRAKPVAAPHPVKPPPVPPHQMSLHQAPQSQGTPTFTPHHQVPQAYQQEQLPGFRPTPRSKSHDILRPEELSVHSGGEADQKYHTMGRAERQRPAQDRSTAFTPPDDRQRNKQYTRVISPQPFVGDTHSLDRYNETSDRFPRYQPQKHYPYLRYTQAVRQSRPAENRKSASCLKESSV